MAHSAFIGLGGNLGDAQATLITAIQLLTSDRHIRSWRMSSLLETTPEQPLSPQPHYWNGVLLLRTDERPWALFRRMRQIEKKLGKSPKPQHAPRPIDLDLLWISGMRSSLPYLQLPHPRFMNRRFVLEPLLEIVPEIAGLPPLQEALATCPTDQKILQKIAYL